MIEKIYNVEDNKHFINMLKNRPSSFLDNPGFIYSGGSFVIALAFMLAAGFFMQL